MVECSIGRVLDWKRCVRVQHWKSVEDWKSVELEECMIGRVYDWKSVRLEECMIRRV